MMSKPHKTNSKKILSEKAESKAQHRLMSMAYAYKKGELDLSKVGQPDEIKKIANSMSLKELKKYAKTKETGLPQHVKEEYSIKQLIEGMTFSSFLIVEQMPDMDTSTVRGFIRSLPQYQELMKDQSNKPEALKLARRMMDEFGDTPLDQNTKDYIFDQFDELSSQNYRGTMVGDWKGEDEYQRKKREDRDLEGAVNKWEQTTGMNAVTGADIPHKRRMSGARVGMEYTPGRKAQRAQADIASFANAPAPEQASRLASARTQAAGVGTPSSGSKIAAARVIFNKDFGEKRPSEIINRMVNEIGISKPHATTYYYKFKKAAQ